MEIEQGELKVRSVIGEMANQNLLWAERVRQMMYRRNEFASPMTAQLAAIASMPSARDFFERELDAMWAQPVTLPTGVGEVVIGSGLHAAIYCAVRVASGYPKPLVLEAEQRVGGAFAISRGASFFLNSRNRPGALGLPGDAMGLNVLPGAPIQPADIGADEYQRNDDLAYVIRTTLAMNAIVANGCVVNRVDGLSMQQGGGYDVVLANGSSVRANRVIVAPGMGAEVVLPGQRETKMAISFMEFMASLDSDFPMRGMKRVAVIGGGDSGKTAVEALVGQGPARTGSVAALDWVEKIDWYAQNLPNNRGDFQSVARPRYQRIGCLLGRQSSDPSRLRVINEAVSIIADAFGNVIVNERPYDRAIVCIGQNPGGAKAIEIIPDANEVRPTGLVIGGREVGRRYAKDVFMIGPGARLGLTDAEVQSSPSYGRVPENSGAIFRYAPRTASLAANLSGVPVPPEPPKMIKVEFMISPLDEPSPVEIIASQATENQQALESKKPKALEAPVQKPPSLSDWNRVLRRARRTRQAIAKTAQREGWLYVGGINGDKRARESWRMA